MKPNVFSENWEDVMFALRDASKILLHFHTLVKLSEVRRHEASDFLDEFCDKYPEEDVQLIFGGASEMAEKLIAYSNDILDFYTDGIQYIEDSDYVDLLKEIQDNKPGSIAYDFISYWCVPDGKLSDEEYMDFSNRLINGGCSVPSLAYKVLRVLKYDEFLKTRYWMSISRFVREKSGKCEECGSTENLHVHHTTYVHHGCEHQHLEDLKCLCKDCHLKTHHELNKKS